MHFALLRLLRIPWIAYAYFKTIYKDFYEDTLGILIWYTYFETKHSHKLKPAWGDVNLWGKKYKIQEKNITKHVLYRILETTRIFAKI